VLEIDHVSLAIGGNPILHDLSLKLRGGKVYCVLGPSGSGKTSLLRVIAGLERGYIGRIVWEGKPIDALDAQSRGFGLMFQDFALFPHLSVLENVAFALKMRGIPRSERETTARDLLRRVGLEAMAARGVHQLSGGERQRVALVRSLAYQPHLLMLDEPLGSLDAGLRQQLGMELRQRLREASVMSLYVTHDQNEAFMLADFVIVMASGRIVQVDTPQALYFRPRTRFVCEFLGLNNVVPAGLLGRAGQWLCLHPAGIKLDAAGEWEGVVLDVTFEGYQTAIKVQWRDCLLSWRVPSLSCVPQVGELVRFTVDESTIVTLSDEKDPQPGRSS